MAKVYLCSVIRLSDDKFVQPRFMITSSEPWNTTQSINEVISCCLEASGNSLMEAKNSLIQQLEYLAEIAPIWKRILDEVDPSMEAYMRRMPLSDEW